MGGTNILIVEIFGKKFFQSVVNLYMDGIGSPGYVADYRESWYMGG